MNKVCCQQQKNKFFIPFHTASAYQIATYTNVCTKKKQKNAEYQNKESDFFTTFANKT